MNDKLKNYTEQPDASVWQRITHTMATRKAVRRASWTAAGLVAVGAVVFIAIPRNEEVPMTAELSIPAAVESATQSVVPVPTQEEPKATESKMFEAKASKQAEPEKAATTTITVPVASEAPVRVEETVAATVEPRPAASVQKEDPVIYVGEPVAPKSEESHATDVRPEDNPPDKSPANSGVSNVADMLLWFPNVFAPSSDNDDINRFRAQLNREDAVVKDFRMAIYNRAGARVFFTSDINEAWDGTRDGQPLPQSAYVYVVFYTDGQDVQHHCKGTVTLVR